MLPLERQPEEVPPERAAETLPVPPGETAPAGDLVAVTIDGVAVKVPKGSTIFQASEQAGYTPPHFCYHRDLSIPANCRMCLCEVEGQGKLQPSCTAVVADGMAVRFDTDSVREAIQGVMEFEFKNHPLDCPVCDQVGECYLQRYYLEVGKYVPLPIERVHKDKVKDLGPITLDAERCVLCTRCVRFGEEIAGTADFVIAHRSDHSEIMTFDDRPIGTQYALNYTDICPVGALTSNDFRFRKRVYYLESTHSVCPECSTGCNVYADTAENELYRYRPRYNDAVNDSWMCDPGRLSHARMADTSDRLVEPTAGVEPLGWEEAVRRAAEGLGRLGGSVAAIAHPDLSNEDLAALAALVRAAGGDRIDFRADDSWRGVDELVDGILIRRDPHANTRGALEILGLAGSESAVASILSETAAGRLRGLIVCGWSPEALGEAGRKAIEKAEWAVFAGPREVPGLEVFDLVLPTCVHVEREGTFTNHAGRVQRFQAALTPYEASRPAWRVFEEIRAAIAGDAPAAGPAEAFARVAEAAPAFAGLSLEQVGDQGIWLRGYEQESTSPVGADPRPGVRAPNIG
ncbi:MAG TPA: 2Fe-2S iron-sulfur cluster-binding protein [Gemmatimonadota bacterium]|nr:2Fe-2S iron-sulfur cluster-binding protein [Gemmatimonadota bacterium]